MAYRISKTDGSIIPVPDYEFERNQTSLVLWGRGVINFGEPTASNFLHLLENFSGPTPPENQIKGQLWFQPGMNRLKVFSDDQQKGTAPFDQGWEIVGAAANGALPPLNKVDGDLWLNPNNHQLYYWNHSDWIATSLPLVSEDAPTGNVPDGTTWFMMPERMLWIYDSAAGGPQPVFTREGGTNNGNLLSGNWRLVGPLAPAVAQTYMSYKTVQVNGNPVRLMLTYIDGVVVSVYSSATAFQIPSSQIQAGFRSRNPDGTPSSGSTTWIYPGLTVNENVDGVFGGTALNSKRLDGLELNTFLGNGRDPVRLPAAPYATATVDLGTAALRWQGLYSHNVYAGASGPGNADISQVNLFGKASSAAQADKWTSPRTGTFDGLWLVGNQTFDGSGNYTITTSGFGSAGTQFIQTTATNAANSSASSLAGQFIAKNGSTTGFSGNLGNSGDKFSTIHANTFAGTASSANYADLAERYEADTVYPVGTIVKIGGSAEITATTQQLDPDAFGVISEAPGYLMNAEAGSDETHPAVALFGRVPVRIVGKVSKGQRIVTSNIPGVGVAAEVTDVDPFFVIGRALEDSDTETETLVMCVVRARI